MSTGASIWRNAVSLVTHSGVAAIPAESSESETSQGARCDPALVALVHQLFSFQSGVGRKRIFFVGSGRETDIREFCRRAGNCLARAATGNVALVYSGSQMQDGTNDPSNFEMSSASGVSDEVFQLAPKLWNVPFRSFQKPWGENDSVGAAARYEYAILGADVSDSVASAFSQCCDAAVLVLSANQTRREVALRAKETLSGWNTNLLGAVLDNRTFPIPESIYRRL